MQGHPSNIYQVLLSLGRLLCMNNKFLRLEVWPLYALMTAFWVFFISVIVYNEVGSPMVPGQYPNVTLQREPFRPFSPVLKVVMPAKFKGSDPASLSPYGPGMEQELLKLFVERHDYKLRRIYADSYDEAMAMLERNSVDIMVGFGCEPAFKPAKISRSPVLSEFYPVMVMLPDANDKSEEESLKSLDLTNVLFNKIGYSASQLAALQEHKGRAVLIDPATYALIMPMHTSMKTAGQLAEKTGYYWFWNSGDRKVDLKLAEFWKDPLVDTLVAELGERYYGFMPKRPRQHQLREINRVISDSIGTYSAHIAKAAAANDIDPLLLSAVIFQESRFNPAAHSYTGVRGIMQLTNSTADMLGVDRLDPEAAIMGGARYLRKIYNSLAHLEDVNEWDKWYLTLAGFNQGPTVMHRAVKAAGEDGLSQDWASVRKVYPGLYDRGLASSGFRPDEAVRYVESIRYYYYVLSGLANVGWPEHQDLAALLATSTN